MNNEDFDKMIRDSVGNQPVAPSDQLGKSLSRVMLFKNIWFFHKTKAFLILLCLGTVSFPLWNKFSNNSAFKETLAIYTNEEDGINANKLNKNEAVSRVKSNKAIDNNEHIESSSKEFNYEKVNHDEKSEEEISNEVKKAKEKKQDKYSTYKTSIKNTSLKNKKETLVLGIQNSEQFLNKEKQALLPNAIVSNEVESVSRISSKKAFHLNSEIDRSVVDFTFEAKAYEVDYVKYKGTFSIDAYFTPFNQLIIKNELNEAELSSEYEKKEWDFYTNEGIVNSGFSGGVRVNYNWKSILISSGVKVSNLRDYKPMYKYEQIENEELLEYVNLSEISGVQIQDKDSAHYVFHTDNNEELISRLENDNYNVYKYLSIPLRIGYEFKQEKYSLVVQAGGIYNRLLKTKGTYLRKYNNLEEFDVYYNRGIETSLLEKENTMLKENYFSLIGALVANVKITSSFDVFGEVNYIKSFKNITKQDYFIKKKAQSLSANFGIRYYLKPKTKLI